MKSFLKPLCKDYTRRNAKIQEIDSVFPCVNNVSGRFDLILNGNFERGFLSLSKEDAEKIVSLWAGKFGYIKEPKGIF